MARPERNNVDYFPFYCEEGKKMYFIEETYGNDGFAVFIKILRELAKTDYHYLDLSKKTTLMFLSAKCKVSIDILNSIINDLVELEKFDAVLWSENRIIWCQDFIDSIQDAYNKRKNKCITYDGLLSLLVSLGVRKPNKSTSIGTGNTQTKENYTKEEKIKEKESLKSYDEIQQEELQNWENIKSELCNSFSWIESRARCSFISPDEAMKYLNKFLQDRFDCDDIGRKIKEYKNHFQNWLPIQIKKDSEIKDDNNPVAVARMQIEKIRHDMQCHQENKNNGNYEESKQPTRNNPSTELC